MIYTQIFWAIYRVKEKLAEAIKFSAPKFAITSNWVVP
jgi:hypothetical protein